MPLKITSKTDDQELTRLLRDGSKEAFRLLYTRYGTKIRHFARGYLKHEQDAGVESCSAEFFFVNRAFNDFFPFPFAGKIITDEDDHTCQPSDRL